MAAEETPALLAMEPAEAQAYLPDSPNSPDSPLHAAAEANDAAAVRRLAAGGVDLDALDSQLQYTAAIHAASNDSVDALGVLKEHGADLEKPGRRGVTCVFAAAAKGAVRSLDLLIKAGAELDGQYDEYGDGDGETALEWLGLPCETGSLHGSRLNGDRLLAAQMLLLGGAFVEAGTIVHRHSRSTLHAWARHELAVEAGFRTFVMGVHRGRTSLGAPCALSQISADGIPQRVASYLKRRTPDELRRLARAARVWDAEIEDEAYRAETRAFPRQGYCIDVF